MDVWEWLDLAVQEEPACADRVAALKALRETEPEQAEADANDALGAIWAALDAG